MGQADEDLMSVAQSIGGQTGALEECPHGEYLSTGDDEAVQQAYAVATNMLKRGEIKANRKDMMDAIKNYVENAGDECYTCSKNEHE